jgi:serine/threonine-protein kinase
MPAMPLATDGDLAATLEARIAADGDIARTFVERPRETIEPPRPASSGAMQALNALRALGGSLQGKIDVHETLGEGGMGVVHLATQATMGRHVAVKTMRAGKGDVAATLRILREAWVTGALEHPNVVPVYDVGIDGEGSPIIVMKRIEGRAWSDLMRDPPEIARRFGAKDPLEWNLGILGTVCNAVHFAHSRGILHRDLKPDNVMIGEFGEVYVLDWGIAISLREDPSGRLPPASLAKDIAGTPSYMAPEMLIADPGAYSPRTDVYLLGAILYEIFAGLPPHQGTSMNAIVSSVLLSTPEFPTGFPPEGRRIVERAMRRDPKERYESAADLRRAIEAYVQHRGSRRLANEAKQSLVRLQEVIEREPRGEERTLAIANLLGECRFGYRAALSAWAENEGARHGLDRALLVVIEHELAEGEPYAAANLLREVSAPPPAIAARVEAAIKARAEQEERLRQLETDTDPRVGRRTRAFLSGMFGLLWTAWPLVGWCYAMRGGPVTHLVAIIEPAVVTLLLGAWAYSWAKETMMKTALNRRFAQTFAFYAAAQALLGAGAWIASISVVATLVILQLAWALTYSLLAVWAERWFALPAVVSALSFLVSAGFPRLALLMMSLDSLVFMVTLVRVWVPPEDIAKVQERRAELRRRARRWIVDAAVAPAAAGGKDRPRETEE